MRNNILTEAIRLCLEDRCPCCPTYLHCCIGFRGKKIISMGMNCRCHSRRKVGPIVATLHAELSAIFKIRDGKPFDILVIRTNKNGSRLLISKPCLRCSKWIKNYPINRVFYSDGCGSIISIAKKDLLKTNVHLTEKTALCCSLTV